jgi:hypothetical protein
LKGITYMKTIIINLPGKGLIAGRYVNRISATACLPLLTMLVFCFVFCGCARSADKVSPEAFVSPPMEARPGAYYGDQAPNLVPPRRLDPHIKPIHPPGKCLHCGRDLPVDFKSLGSGYGYDYIDANSIIKRMKFDPQTGQLVVGNMRYRLMVLPDHDHICLDVLHKICDLVKQGATIVGSIRPIRTNSLTGYPEADRRVEEITGNAGKDFWLDLGEVCVVANVSLDGQNLGTAWTYPFRVKVPAKLLTGGMHNLEVKVTNVWNNRLVGDKFLVEKDRITRTNIQGKFNKNTPLVVSGLLGPVTLQPVK